MHRNLKPIESFGLVRLLWPLLRRSIPSKRGECSTLEGLSRIPFLDRIRAGHAKQRRLPHCSEPRQPSFISQSEVDTGTYAGREESDSGTWSQSMCAAG